LKNYQGPFASKVVLGAIWLHIARKNRAAYNRVVPRTYLPWIIKAHAEVYHILIPQGNG
jgi:hypothetical protein